METHRCEKSLKNKVSIRRDYKTKYMRSENDTKEWRVFCYQYDFEFGTTYPICVAEVEYCPFCGKMLRL